MPRKPTLKLAFVTLAALLLFPSPGPCAADAAEPHPNLNILIITVDDMSADSVGAFGCRLADTTPNLDRLAAQGMRFTRAHVVCANCMPSRNAMWSGLYPHHNGVEGFYQVPGAKHPHLADLMKRAGYFTAIQHKVSHSTPYSPYPAWDLDLDIGPDGRRRDVKAPRSYGEGTAQGIEAARDAGKPFCLVINIADPHKPLYIFNPWSNGQRIMATATSGTPTYRRLAELARTNPALEARHRLYQLRVPEELYDVEQDPDCLKNLIDSPAHQEELRGLCQTVEQWMVRTDDPMLDVFRKRGDAAVREAFVAAQEKEAEARRVGDRGKAKPKAAAKTAASKAARRRNADWIALVLPPTIAPGKPITVKIEHRLPAELGRQVLTVTLKGGPEGRRVDRKTVQASGQGTAEVTFDVPAAVPGNVVSFAVFVGEDFQTSPQHLQSDPIAVQ